ncbi:hypothetical protein [Streptomyces parvus]
MLGGRFSPLAGDAEGDGAAGEAEAEIVGTATADCPAGPRS